jgi:transposase
VLRWISVVGGLLIMMGRHDRSEALFYYFRLEDQIPGTHLLRLIDKHIRFEFVRQQLKDSYSETGRPSIDPELLLRMLLIGYLYGISSERKLVEELRMHLAWRWFTGLGFDQEIPHHSTFSKNRHGRFQESKLFEQLFEQIVRQCVEVGLVQGKHLSVDGSFVEANAAKESRIPREQLAEAAQVHQTVRQYLKEVEEQNPVEEPVHQQEQVSTTDPDATYATKGGPVALAALADQRLHATPAQLRDALGACRELNPVYRRLLKMTLEDLHLIEQQVGQLDQEIATGNRHMRRILNQAANAAVKHKGSIFEIVYRRLVPRLGHNKTIGAIAHRLCQLIWIILHNGVRYEERGPAVSEKSRRARTSRMIRTLRTLGYRVEPLRNPV